MEFIPPGWRHQTHASVGGESRRIMEGKNSRGRTTDNFCDRETFRNSKAQAEGEVDQIFGEKRGRGPSIHEKNYRGGGCWGVFWVWVVGGVGGWLFVRGGGVDHLPQLQQEKGAFVQRFAQGGSGVKKRATPGGTRLGG